MHWHRQTDTYPSHTHTDTVFWSCFTRGSSGGSPISVGCVWVCVHVHLCVSVCWAGSDQNLLILVHRITARLSHPITALDCWRTQHASVRVCAAVCRSPPAVSCWRDEPQVSTCDLAGLALISITLRGNPIALILVSITELANIFWSLTAFFSMKEPSYLSSINLVGFSMVVATLRVPIQNKFPLALSGKVTFTWPFFSAFSISSFSVTIDSPCVSHGNV